MSTTDIHNSTPNLQDICTEVVSCHDYWIVQKRHLQYLPEHTANRLLQLLLQRGRLQSPALLDVFRHSVTAVHIDAKQLGLQLGAEWISYIAGLSHLQQLSIQYSTRLKDKHLSQLTRLSGCLTSLDISGCSSLTNKTCADVLGRLTSLQSLVLTGTSIHSPIFNHLQNLSCLTHLDLGGLEVDNSDITRHITTFTNLQTLILWGSQIGDTSIEYLLQLPDLRHLSLAWSQIRYDMPLHDNLTMLDLSHCQLVARWQADEGLLMTAGSMKLREIVMAHTELSPVTGEVFEAVLRASSPYLQLLDLSGFSGVNLLPLLLPLESATALHSLSLSNTGLTDDYCPALGLLSALQTLDLSLNPEITALGLNVSLPSLQGLRRLNCAGTGFWDDALGVVWGLPRLQELVLADTAVAWEWESPLARGQLQQQQQEEDVAVDQSGNSQLRLGSRGLTNWQSLQVLDLSNAQATDAGCIQLGLQLGPTSTTPPGVINTSHPNTAGGSTAASTHGSNGWQVLSIGGSSSKITKTGLAALGKIVSLQKLTLQGCQLQDRDLKHLSQLQRLQQLHIQHIDPWLLSDTALQELPVEHGLPNLMLVTRDGKPLYAALNPVAGVQMWRDDSAGSPVVGLGGVNHHRHHQQQQQSWLRQEQINLVEVPTAFGTHASRYSGKGSSNSRTVTSVITASSKSKRVASTVTPPAAAAATTVYKRLSEYDERYRYSREDLLRLQQQQQQQQQAWKGLSSIPEWLRSSTSE